jgi:hypothetical protein
MIDELVFLLCVGLNARPCPFFLQNWKSRDFNSSEKSDHDICCDLSLWTAARHRQLFQKRCKSSICQEYTPFKELVRYIHFNIPRADVVSSPSELEICPYRAMEY